jgi:hypothetical protein
LIESAPVGGSTKDLHLMSGSGPTEAARSRVLLTLLAIGVAAVSTAAAPAHAQQAVIIVRHGEKAEAPKDNPRSAPQVRPGLRRCSRRCGMAALPL